MMLIAVLADRIQAESVYLDLEKEKIPMSQVSILGKGYKTADEYGLIDPNEQARKQVLLMGTWLIPFGFFAGTAFSSITNLHTFAWAGEIGDHLIGGLLGAISGAMGSVFVGGGVGLIIGGGDALPYRNRLNMGKYLIVVEGSEMLIERSTRILRKSNPENIQAYRNDE